MSFDISRVRSRNPYQDQNQNGPEVKPIMLILAGSLVVFILLIYACGNVNATLLATSRPVPGRDGNFLMKGQFRGLPIFIFHRLTKLFLLSRFNVKETDLFRLLVLNVATELLLSNLKVSNVHTILAQPLQIPFYRRVLSWSVWWKTFPATLLYSTASSVCFYLTVDMFVRILRSDEGLDGLERRAIGTLLMMSIFYFLAVVPTYAIFIRVAASTMHEAGSSARKTQPTGSIKSAWESFHWSDRWRFAGILATVLFLETCVTLYGYVLVIALFHPELHEAVLRFCIRYAC